MHRCGQTETHKHGNRRAKGEGEEEKRERPQRAKGKRTHRPRGLETRLETRPETDGRSRAVPAERKRGRTSHRSATHASIDDQREDNNPAIRTKDLIGDVLSDLKNTIPTGDEIMTGINTGLDWHDRDNRLRVPGQSSRRHAPDQHQRCRSERRRGPCEDTDSRRTGRIGRNIERCFRAVRNERHDSHHLTGTELESHHGLRTWRSEIRQWRVQWVNAVHDWQDQTNVYDKSTIDGVIDNVLLAVIVRKAIECALFRSLKSQPPKDDPNTTVDAEAVTVKQFRHRHTRLTRLVDRCSSDLVRYLKRLHDSRTSIA
jgi:hypothetical protein